MYIPIEPETVFARLNEGEDIRIVVIDTCETYPAQVRAARNAAVRTILDLIQVNKRNPGMIFFYLKIDDYDKFE